MDISYPSVQTPECSQKQHEVTMAEVQFIPINAHAAFTQMTNGVDVVIHTFIALHNVAAKTHKWQMGMTLLGLALHNVAAKKLVVDSLLLSCARGYRGSLIHAIDNKFNAFHVHARTLHGLSFHKQFCISFWPIDHSNVLIIRIGIFSTFYGFYLTHAMTRLWTNILIIIHSSSHVSMVSTTCYVAIWRGYIA